MNGPRRVQPAGAECPQAFARPHVGALPRAQERTPMRPGAGGTACRPPAPRAFPTRQQAPVAGRVPLPATGAYHSRSEAPRGLSNPVGIHLNFALGLSNEVGPPHIATVVNVAEDVVGDAPDVVGDPVEVRCRGHWMVVDG